MTTELWLNSLAISMDSKKADGMRFVINLKTPDNGESFVVEMSNSALTNIKGQQAKNPDLTITVNRSDLNGVMGGQTSFDQLAAQGKVTFDGDRSKFEQLKSVMTTFTPDFELVPGTRVAKPAPKVTAQKSLEVIPPAETAGE